MTYLNAICDQTIVLEYMVFLSDATRYSSINYVGAVWVPVQGPDLGPVQSPGLRSGPYDPVQNPGPGFLATLDKTN